MSKSVTRRTTIIRTMRDFDKDLTPKESRYVIYDRVNQKFLSDKLIEYFEICYSAILSRRKRLHLRLKDCLVGKIIVDIHDRVCKILLIVVEKHQSGSSTYIQTNSEGSHYLVRQCYEALRLDVIAYNKVWKINPKRGLVIGR